MGKNLENKLQSVHMPSTFFRCICEYCISRVRYDMSLEVVYFSLTTSLLLYMQCMLQNYCVFVFANHFLGFHYAQELIY